MAYQDVIYRHRKGHFYRIVHFGLDEETLEPEVAYRRCDREGRFMEGQTFHRKCTVFFDGRFWPLDNRDEEQPEIPNIFVDIDEDPASPEVAPTFVTRRPEPLVLDEKAFLAAGEIAPPRRVIPRRVAPKTELQIDPEKWPEGGFGDGPL